MTFNLITRDHLKAVSLFNGKISPLTVQNINTHLTLGCRRYRIIENDLDVQYKKNYKGQSLMMS